MNNKKKGEVDMRNRRLPKLIKRRLEKLDEEIKLFRKYARQCRNPDNLKYWNHRIDKLQEKKFLMEVIGHGLVAMSKSRKRRRK